MSDDHATCRTPEWQRLRNAVLQRDQQRCCVCGKAAACVARKLERADADLFDKSALESLCRKCFASRTGSQTKAARARQKIDQMLEDSWNTPRPRFKGAVLPGDE